MGIKREIPIILCLFLVATFILYMRTHVSFASPETKVCVDPTEKTVYLYDTFMIDVKVTDVVDIYAYNVKLYYDTIPLDGLSVELPPGHFFEPLYGPENFVVTRKEIDDNYNGTHGRVWVSVNLLPGRPRVTRCMLHYVQDRKSGSGVLFTITFHCTGGGTSALNLHETQLIRYGDNPISHNRIHGLIDAYL